MDSRTQAPSIARAAGLIFILLLAVSRPASAAPICGPGAHWVDTCGSGTDSFNARLTVAIDDAPYDNIPNAVFSFFGPVTIFRGNPVDTPDPLDPGHLNHIDTELVSMTLTGGGFTLIAGDGTGNLSNDGPLFSGGGITEQPGNPFWADSFFDIFVEVQGCENCPLHNRDPIHMTGTMDTTLPVSYNVDFSGPPVTMFGQNGEDSRVISAQLTAVPEPSTLLLLASGLAVLVGFARERTKSTSY